MAKFYPRKQTLLILLVCALVTGLTYFYKSEPQKRTAQPSVSAPISIEPEVLDVANADSDWKSTFETAFSDYKAASSSKIAVQEPLTDTETFGRNFLAKFVELERNGLTSNSQAVESAVAAIVSDATSNIDSPKIYTNSDIIISSNPTSAEYSEYYRTFFDVIQKYVPDEYNNEAIILMNALENEDDSELKKLEPLAQGYEQAVLTLKSTRVPKNLATYHLDVLNSFSGLLFATKSFQLVNTDAMKSMVGLGVWNDVTDRIEKGIVGVSTFMKASSNATI